MRKIYFCILLLFLTGCQSENSKMPQSTKGPLSSDHTSDETVDRAHPFSVWDGLEARHDEEDLFTIDSPDDLDQFNLYLEGLLHSNPYVQ